MEYGFRKHLPSFQTPDFEAAATAILTNEDVLFMWSILSSDWEVSSAPALLEMLVKERYGWRLEACAWQVPG